MMNWSHDPRPSWELWVENDDDPDDDLPEPEAQEFPDLMDSQQAAEFLGVSKIWINELVRKGKLEAITVRRANYFHKADLAAYLVERGGKD